MMVAINLRRPVVAGQFYPAAEKEIRQQIASWADEQAQKSDCLGCVLPHAGYIYSGNVAVSTVSRVKLKSTLVLLGPNHTGLGADYSLAAKGSWQTPLGSVRINRELAGLFLKNSRLLQVDTLAHEQEHSLEVQLPILQYFQKDFQIVPIAIMDDRLERLEMLGEELAAVIIDNHLQSKVTFIASSDMTHYEPQESAKAKDASAIEAILELDAVKLVSRVLAQRISMCGFAPVAVLLTAARKLGAKKGELVKYQTSGDASGDYQSVVGYAGITIY